MIYTDKFPPAWKILVLRIMLFFNLMYGRMPHREKEKNNFTFVGAAVDQERE